MSLDQGASTSQAAEESVSKNMDVPLSERNMRQLNRSFNKAASEFSKLLSEKKDFQKVKEVFIEITKCFEELLQFIEINVDNLNPDEENDKIEDYIDKRNSAEVQYSMIKHHYNETEAKQKILFANLRMTSSKGTTTNSSSRSSCMSRKSKGLLSSIMMTRNLTPKQIAMLTENSVKMAEEDLQIQKIKLKKKMLEAELANKLVVSDSLTESEERCLNRDSNAANMHASQKNYCSMNECTNVGSHVNVVHGGSTNIRTLATDICDDVEQPQNVLEANKIRSVAEQADNAVFDIDGLNSHKLNPTANLKFGIGDNYLAGKVLMESGSKVAFDGDPKNYIAFRHGMERVISIYGKQYGLMYDILQSRCSGKAADAIRCCDRIRDPEVALNTALNKLHKFFGQSSLVVEAHISYITRNEPVKWNLDSFQSFMNELEDIKTLFADTDEKSMLASPGVLKKVIARLPKRTKDKLAEILCNACIVMPSFDYLLCFVEKQLKLIAHPLMQTDVSNVKPKYDFNQTSAEKKRPAKQFFVKTYAQNSSAFLCPVSECDVKNVHALWRCDKFRELNLKDKWSVAKKSKCCFKCLNSGHLQSKCRSKYCCRACQSDDHHFLLCMNDKPCLSVRANNDGLVSDVDGVNAKVHSAILNNERKILPIIPVIVHSEASNQSVKVNCLLDTGSDNTLATKRLMKLLKIPASARKKSCVKLSTANACTREDGCKVDLVVCGVKDGTSFKLKDVVCVEEVASHNNPDKKENIELSKIPHLKDIEIPIIETKNVDLLIGSNYEELLDMTEVRRRKECRVAAKLSKFGWLLVGHTGMRDGGDVDAPAYEKLNNCSDIHCNRICMMENSNEYMNDQAYLCNGDADTCELLHAEIKRWMNYDFETAPDDEDTAPSANDIICTKMYDQSIRKKNGRYFLSLPIKSDVKKMPYTKGLAKHRLMQQRRSLKRDELTQKFYCDAIQKLIDTDKIERVDTDDDEKNARVFYIPHFVTKQAKRRLVYDGSAKSDDICLNALLHQGKDDLQRLSDVLIRFRRFPVAFSCDIQEMFMQCGINEKDRDLLRILWFGNHDFEAPVVTYRFRRLPFGLNCSMSMADYCLKKTATDNDVGVSPETVNLVKNSFYVDDGLVSCKNVEEGKVRVSELVELLKSGGFEVRKFVSDHPEILECLEHDKKLLVKDSKDLTSEDNLNCKVLGLQWNPSKKTLFPKVNIQEKPKTKRGLWSTIAQIFDPIGMCAPYMLKGRILLQKVCEEVELWDDPVPTTILKSWEKWIAGLPCLEKLTIPRCYWDIEADVYELHTFCDSSEKGLGCVSYLKMVKNDLCNVAFVMGKSKVVPRRTTLSIPRLELIAAVIGANMHRNIKSSIQLPISRGYLHSDSSVVLDWIKNHKLRLKKYVARKIAEINRLTGDDTWCYVATSSNVADLCSRGIDPKKADPGCVYLKGPAFLYEQSMYGGFDEKQVVNACQVADIVNDECLNVCPEKNDDDDTEACINLQVGHEERLSKNVIDHRMPEYFYNIVRRYSDLFSCIKMIVYRYRYVVSKLHTKNLKLNMCVEVGCIKNQEFILAELDLIRMAQESYFGCDVLSIIGQRGFDYALKSCSGNARTKLLEIKNLLPFYDHNLHVLRVGGRVVKSSLPNDSIHQYILPKASFITEMFIKHEHIVSNHFGANYVLCKLLKKFWICYGLSTVKKYLRDCHYCKLRRAKAAQQIMGNLPECRVNAPKFPFQNSGVDLFGPIDVKLNRSIVKRWGVLFICMASRACHIEIVPELSTDSFIQCFMRFTARRGMYCRTLFSDQGTNFKGCDAEFKKLLQQCKMQKPKICIDEIDKSFVSQCMSRKCVDVVWKFNVPANPHAGGNWERAIRTVKNVMAAIIHNGITGLTALKSRTPSDFELLTIMCEVEATMNCRPITKLSNEVEDWRVLTPLSILTGNLHPDSPVHEFNKAEMYRSNYKLVIAVSEQFWERWLQMYVPWLQIRHRWLDVKPNLNAGDIVLLKEDVDGGRRDYPKAIVVKTFPDANGRVRSIKLKLADGRTFDRDIRKVAPLEGLI